MADSKHTIEVTLTGVFTTVDVYLEGNEVNLQEVEAGKFLRTLTDFSVDDTLDITGLLKGWPGMSWALSIIVDGQEATTLKGTFDRKNKGVMTIPQTHVTV